VVVARVFSPALPHITVGLPAKFSVPLLITGVALVVLTMRRCAINGSASHGFPVVEALLYAARVAQIILVPSGVKQRQRSMPGQAVKPQMPVGRTSSSTVRFTTNVPNAMDFSPSRRAWVKWSDVWVGRVCLKYDNWRYNK
jgi:hypothetical protein